MEIRIINSDQDLAEVMASKVAIVFIHARWSAPSVWSRRLFGGWAGKAQPLASGSPVVAWHFDIDLPFCQSWLWGKFGMVDHGAGGMLWLRSGSLFAYVANAALAGERELDLWTRVLCSLGSPPEG